MQIGNRIKQLWKPSKKTQTSNLARNSRILSLMMPKRLRRAKLRGYINHTRVHEQQSPRPKFPPCPAGRMNCLQFQPHEANSATSTLRLHSYNPREDDAQIYHIPRPHLHPIPGTMASMVSKFSSTKRSSCYWSWQIFPNPRAALERLPSSEPTNFRKASPHK